MKADEGAIPGPGKERADSLTGNMLLFGSSCILLLLALALCHLHRANFWAADDLRWLEFSKNTLKDIWGSPSPFGHYRPLFGTWLLFLRIIGAGSPLALGMAGMVLLLLGAVLAFRLLRFWLDTRGAYLAALLMTIHPLREQNIFWLSAQIDSCCLLFSLASLIAAVKFRSSKRMTMLDGLLITLLTTLACLGKESALLLPLLVLFLPAGRSLRRRMGAFFFSGLGVVFYAATATNFLNGIGRNMSLIAGFNLKRLLFYPAQLLWPADIPVLLLRARVYKEYWPGVLMLVCLSVFILLAGRFCTIERRQKWLRSGLIFIAAGAAIFCFNPEHRGLGFGCLGISILAAGIAVHGKAFSMRSLSLPLAIFLALAWLPCWIGFYRAWTNAKCYSRNLRDSIVHYRKSESAHRLFVLLGTISTIRGTAWPMNSSEIDSCCDNILLVNTTNRLEAIRVQKAGKERYMISPSGSSRFVLGCPTEAGPGVDRMSCQNGRYISSLRFCKRKYVSSRSDCIDPLFLYWNGSELTILD